ncbi:MAG: hypothetical protein O7B26_10905, partial [Planctomycetota bacterium]|nr:hypothetical protein [Planctomycetota bacterium]
MIELVRRKPAAQLTIAFIAAAAGVLAACDSQQPAGNPLPGLPEPGVVVHISNQAGVTVSIEAVFLNGPNEVRRTNLRLAANGATSVGETIRTIADNISVVVMVTPDGSDQLPPGLQAGQVIGRAVFSLGVDFQDGDTIRFVIRFPPDCDDNGNLDAIEIFQNPGLDCNDNFIIDACDIDPSDPDLNGLISADCDADGTPDECQIDSDGDGIIDACDACPNDSDKVDPGICGCNMSDVDSDGDGVPDGCDPCPVDNLDDSDGDGVCDNGDICPGFNDNADADGDGTPNGCDPCPADAFDDSDGDGVCDSQDICQGFDDNTDTDNDGVPDGCDPCPDDALDDSDGDGVCDSDDLCQGFDDNADADGNGIPDGCDPCPLDDSDGDGVCDSEDVCPGFDDFVDGVPDGCDPCPNDSP